MITKKITYEDFNGNIVTEEVQFHLTKSELLKMQLSEQGGMISVLEKMLAEHDTPKLVKYFDSFIVASYGKKSEDGKRFIKTKELTDAFTQGLAYDQLIIELLQDADNAAEFLKGILPKELSAQVNEEVINEAKERVGLIAAETTGGTPEVEDATNNYSEN